MKGLNTMKKIDIKSLLIGILATVLVMVTVVAVSGDETGRYIEVETIGTLNYMLDTTNGDLYSINRTQFGNGIHDGGWRKAAKIEDENSSTNK